jgi:glucose/arabinose dehydrogenase
VYAAGHHSPQGFDWHPATGALWVIDARAEEERVAPADVEAPGLRGMDAERATTLPRHTGASAIVAYRNGRIPALRGDLLVAAAEAGNLLRLRLNLRTNGASIERLLPDGIGPVRAVTVGIDGTIYVIGTSLMTLTPVDPRSPRPTR